MDRPHRLTDRRSGGIANPLDMIEGILMYDLDAAYDPVSGPTSALMTVIRWDADDRFYETALTETIVNRSTTYSAVAGDLITAQFINGEWRPQTGTGGARTDVIDFEVTGYLADINSNFGCNGCYGIVIESGCGSSVNVGDEVMVWDKRACWFNLPKELLIGLTGTAFWMKNPGGLGSLVCASAPEVGDCLWVVKSLCCAEELYG